MRVIVCGSRHWKDPHTIDAKLRELMGYLDPRTVTIVHGDARGADRMAASLASRLGFCVQAVPAHWETYGKTAGPVRNAQMLDMGVDLVMAFKNDFRRQLDWGGTEDMVRLAKLNGIPFIVHNSDGTSWEG